MKVIRKDCHLGAAAFCLGFTLMVEAFEKSTRSLYPIIGSPIKQVKSPDLFNRYFAEQGIDTEMLGIDVSPCD